jgi:hypothetical protein
MEELKAIQEKHKNVRLVYEKVIDNLKVVCKLDSKKDDTINITQSQIINLNESKIIDSSNMNNQSSFNLLQGQPLEEEISKGYFEFLENTKKTVENLLTVQNKEQFLKMMKEKGIEPAVIQRSNTKGGSMVKRNTMASISSQDRLSAKEFLSKPAVLANEEYDYSDEEIRREDAEIKEEKDKIIEAYKSKVIF